MKKFAKLIPVALGLLTLASCSNDDFFTDKAANQEFENLGKGDLVVYDAPVNEDGNAFTRSWRSDRQEDGTYYRKWGKDDEMRVYDNDLHKYDIYSFQSAVNEKSAFRLSTSRVDGDGIAVSNITEAKYAIFPKEDVVEGHWDYNEKSGQTRTTATLRIPENIQYDGTNYNVPGTTDYVPVFEDVVPQWGAVTTTDKGYLETHLHYVTGILRLRLVGTPDYAQYIKVMMIDHETGEPIAMTGTYQTTLATDDVPNLEACLATTGPVGLTSTYGVTTVYPTLDNGYEQPTSAYDDAIWVNMMDPSRDFDDVNSEWIKKSVVYVPLVTTPGRTVDIVAFAAYEEDGAWVEKEFLRLKDKEIKAGVIYGNANFYNLAVDGYDPCSINDALETAEPTTDADGNTIILVTAMNAIGCTSDCHTILIPNIDGVSKIIIDMSKGLFKGNYGQLDIQYADNNDKFTGDVAIIAGAKQGGSPSDFVNINTKLDKSGFGLAGIAFQSLIIDADEFVFGDGETASWNGNGTYVAFSDNVKKLTVSEGAGLRIGNPSTGLINIPEWDGMPWAEEGYGNANLKEFQVNGVLQALINAPEEEVKVVVGDKVAQEKPALLIGGVRTKYDGGATDAAISVLNRAALISLESPDEEGNQTLGFGAYGNIVVTGKSFIQGAAFTKKGDIKINNVDLKTIKGTDNNTFWTDGALLSDIVFNTLGFAWDPTSRFQSQIKPGKYGPLYAEEGSVKIEATNSQLTITDATSYNEAQLNWLEPHALETTTYSVYAKQDIEIGTTDWATNADESWIKIDGTVLFAPSRRGTPNDPVVVIPSGGDDVEEEVESAGLWAEQDVKLYGNTQVNLDVRADRDFTIEGISRSQNVQVGRDATVQLDPMDGKCQAIFGTLTFKKNAAGNKLFLNEGYVNTIDNKDIPVTLNFATKGAFTAIGVVTDPDNLTPNPDTPSIWNGEVMPEALVATYIKGDNIWTATQLAQQSVYNKTTTLKPVIRSNINLAGYPWKGISVLKKTEKEPYIIKGFGDEQKVISGINIVGNMEKTTGIGFINKVTYLEASNLQLNATSTIAPTTKTIAGVGALAGEVAGDADIDHVTVLLSGNFGSDGINNLQLQNVGGFFGKTDANVTMKGVRLGANGAKICGYAALGGFIGDATGKENTITIADAAVTDELGAKQTAVNGLTFNVTYVQPDSDDNPGIQIADLGQGKTGLYIGTVEFSTTTVDINVTEDAITEEYGLEGVYDLSKIYWVKTAAAGSGFTIGDSENKYIYVKFVYAPGNQTLIGQSGDVELTTSKVKLNNKPYYVKKTGSQTYNFTNALYVLVGQDGVLDTGN